MQVMAKKENLFKEKIITMQTDEKIKRRRWNPEDDEELRGYFYNGIGISYIAALTHRTEAAVIHRIQKLKLYPKKTKARKRAE